MSTRGEQSGVMEHALMPYPFTSTRETDEQTMLLQQQREKILKEGGKKRKLTFLQVLLFSYCYLHSHLLPDPK